MLVNDLCSHAYSETAVNEIRLIDRSAVVHIGISEKNLQLELIDYKEHSVTLDSAEGIAILDNWLDFWSGVIGNVAQRTKFVQADLSGGFDSRVSFITLLNSGVNLNEILFRSINDNLHTHAADYAIASQIANHYGFELNTPLPEQKFLNYSLADVFNIGIYHLQTFHTHPRIAMSKSVDKLYVISGFGGEIVRKYWFDSPRNFLAKQFWRTNEYSSALSRELAQSMQKIYSEVFRVVQKKYRIEDPNSLWLAQYLYQETRCRHHFGKNTVGNYFGNNISLSPAIDPELRKVRLNTPDYSDPNLLMAVLFMRYAPDLLTFPFDSKRSIAPEIIACAKQLNERFPRRLIPDKIDWEGVFNLQPRDSHVEQILASSRNNEEITKEMRDDFLKAAFESSRTYGLFTTKFDAEIYKCAVDDYNNRIFGRIRPLHAVLGIAKVVEDVEISNAAREPYRDMERFLIEDFCALPDETQTIKKFRPYFTAMMQVRLLQGRSLNDLQMLAVSDNKANVFPFADSGIVGHVIRSYAGELRLILKATVAGRVQVILFGEETQIGAKNVPIKIDYTNLTIGGNVLFDTVRTASRVNPCACNLDVKPGDEFDIRVAWQPHQ